jgi:hypothetical protein
MMRLLWSNDSLRVDSSNSQPQPLLVPAALENLKKWEGSRMVPRSLDEKGVPRSGGDKSLDSQFKIVAEAFLESFELLEKYAPIWYTEHHNKRGLNAWRILQPTRLWLTLSRHNRIQ